MNDINNYIFLNNNIIGKGSFSNVYLGKNIINNEQVAIKSIQLSKCIKNYDINNEIDILKKLNHINIVNLQDSIHKKNNLYIILEYCPLGDLHSFFKDDCVKEEYVKHYAKQIVDGMAYLNSMNIMHRDIKPQNILLKDIYSIKLTDFGFAKYYKNIDLSSTLCGSPIYMAPEIMRLHKYDYKADIWSIGVVIYELLYNEFPYNANNQFELMNVIKQNNFKFLDKIVISDDCKNFLNSLLEKNPTNRPAYEDIIKSEWLSINNNLNKLNLSSTFQLYNEFIVRTDDNLSVSGKDDDNLSDSGNEESFLNNSEEVFKFDDDDSDTRTDYVFVTNSVTKSHIESYDEIVNVVDNYF
jgi:serine/threonine protein kinase